MSAHLVARIIVAGILLASGLAKLAFRYSAKFFLGPIAYYCITVLEILAGLMVLTRGWRVAAWFAVALALGGILVVLTGVDAKCGCFGSRILSQDLHLVVSGVLGLSGIVSLAKQKLRDRERGRDAARGGAGDPGHLSAARSGAKR